MRDVRVYFHDILSACSAISKFTENKTFADYQADLLLRSGAERQLGIVGEALNQTVKLEPVYAEKITSARRIVDFRNLLIHAYTVVSASTVWSILEVHLPVLRSEVEVLLAELNHE